MTTHTVTSLADTEPCESEHDEVALVATESRAHLGVICRRCGWARIKSGEKARKLAEELVARAPEDDWGSSLAATLAADVARGFLAALADDVVDSETVEIRAGE